MRKFAFGLLCITMLLCAVSCVQALEFRIHDLGVPGTQAKAVDINNAGQIIARSYDESDYTTAFLWSRETGLVDIGSQQFNVAHAINDVGQIAGERATQPDWNPYFAVIRDPDGTVRDLCDLPGAASSATRGINNSGQVVGLSEPYAVLWQPDGSVVQIGDDSYWFSVAIAINNSGRVAGYGYPWDRRGTEAFVWDAATGLTKLPNLPGENLAAIGDISGSGEVLGASGGHAVVWRTDGTVTDLGVGGYVAGVNTPGWMVGNLNERAILWLPDGSRADLGALQGDSYSRALAINDQNWIVGYSYSISGVYHAVLWEPVPEPSGAAGLVAGLLPFGAAWIRARRRRARARRRDNPSG